MKRKFLRRFVALPSLLVLSILPACTKSSAPGAATPGGRAETAESTAMLQRVFPAIVRIEAIRHGPNEGRMVKGWVAGSGVIISKEGHVLTNDHVATDVDFYRCYLFDGEVIEARLVGEDPMTDLAVLQLDLSQRPRGSIPLFVAPFGDSDKLEPGHTVFALGSPGFLSQSSTRGIVANPSLVMPEQTAGTFFIKGEDVGMLVRWILHDATIFGGNSGGPLVNSQGEVIGINEIGVFSLSGAIPGNLARNVANEIITRGRVIRGWSGLTVQARLKASGSGGGVVVSDVAKDSPAAKAGMQPGDVVVVYDTETIADAEEKAIAHFYRIETSRAPGKEVTLEFDRDGKRQKAGVVLAVREPAQTEDVELTEWGAIVHDITSELSRDQRLPSKQGVWFESLRPGGPVGQAEPSLQRGDVLISVDGEPVNSVKDLQDLTKKFNISNEASSTRTVLAAFRRNGAVLNSVVELRLTLPRNPTPQGRRGWLGASSQPLTTKLATRLNIKADGGARLTRIYEGTKAAEAGLKVGDVIVAIDGAPVPARRPEDAGILNQQIRQYRADAKADFSVWRDGKQITVPVVLEAQPIPAAELDYFEDKELEYEVRELAFDDRVRLQIGPEAKGVLVASVVRAGWAALSELSSDDLILKVDGKPVTTVKELRDLRDEAFKANREWLVFLVQRQGQTQLVEINLKHTKKP